MDVKRKSIEFDEHEAITMYIILLDMIENTSMNSYPLDDMFAIKWKLNDAFNLKELGWLD